MGAKPGNKNAQKGHSPATTQLAFRCTPKQRKAVERAAKRQGVTLSEWLNRAVSAQLDAKTPQ